MDSRLQDSVSDGNRDAVWRPLHDRSSVSIAWLPDAQVIALVDGRHQVVLVVKTGDVANRTMSRLLVNQSPWGWGEPQNRVTRTGGQLAVHEEGRSRSKIWVIRTPAGMIPIEASALWQLIQRELSSGLRGAVLPIQGWASVLKPGCGIVVWNGGDKELVVRPFDLGPVHLPVLAEQSLGRMVTSEALTHRLREKPEDRLSVAIRVGGQERGVQLLTSSAEALLDCGRNLLRDGEPEAARATLERARALDPENLEILRTLAGVVSALDEPEAEIRYRQDLVETLGARKDWWKQLDQTVVAFWELGAAFERLTEYRRALEAYGSAHHFYGEQQRICGSAFGPDAVVVSQASVESRIADCFFHDYGGCLDYGKAAHWYELAAQRGDDHSQRMLALCNQHGLGVAVNKDRTRKWYLAAGTPELLEENASYLDLTVHRAEELMKLPERPWVSVCLPSTVSLRGQGVAHSIWGRHRLECRGWSVGELKQVDTGWDNPVSGIDLRNTALAAYACSGTIRNLEITGTELAEGLLKDVLTHAPASLERLRLAGCSNLTDGLLLTINRCVSGGDLLVELDHCEGYTEPGLRVFLRQCPVGLRVLFTGQYPGFVDGVLKDDSLYKDLPVRQEALDLKSSGDPTGIQLGRRYEWPGLNGIVKQGLTADGASDDDSSDWDP